jgi:RNA polymerase sigma-70 factor (ECF subfamily)
MKGSLKTPAGKQTERKLIRKARSGDRAAFGELYRRYARMVHGLLMALVPGDVADDLLQEVFLKAMVQLDQLRDDGHFGGWIAAIARNRAVDHHRHFRELQSTHEIEDQLVAKADVGIITEAQAALAAIRSLPDTYRETLTMRLVEGMSGPEIASTTGLTHDSVRVNLHRGMNLLRERLNKVGSSVGKVVRHD